MDFCSTSNISQLASALLMLTLLMLASTILMSPYSLEISLGNTAPALEHGLDLALSSIIDLEDGLPDQTGTKPGLSQV